MDFVNREKELAALEGHWAKNTAHLFVLYGKRRVGKTELIKQFMRSKPGVYFLADKRTMKDQLAELGRLLGAQFDDMILTDRGFTDWLEVFSYLRQKATQQSFILAIDEYPYLGEVDKATGSLFQKGWDEYLKETKVMLILCGSSVTMMEEEALNYTSPLFGRRSGQLLLRPLSFYQAWEFFPQKPFDAMLELYTIAGGLPAYLLAFDADKSAIDNITAHIFPPTEFLHGEIDFLLRQELRDPKNYLAILKALALGRAKLGEILNETGLEKTIVNKYLGTLARLQLVERIQPVTEKHPEKSRRGRYVLADHFTRFWFHYVYPYKSDLEIAKYDEVLRKLDESFPLLVADAYESVCREVLLRNEQRFFRFERIGKWWEKEQEMDVMAINATQRAIIFGECKWSNKPVGSNIYRELKEKAARVDWHAGERTEHFALFSKSGFTDEMQKIAAQENVALFTMDKLSGKTNGA